MLDFCDDPYCFFEPKPNHLVMALSRTVNRHISLRTANHVVAELELAGALERTRQVITEGGGHGAHVLFVANHSTHSDPQVMTEVLTRLGARTHFMAAYDVFLRGRISAWIMQRNGAFSVDREGSDSKSMKTAVRILAEAPWGLGLTIFPEGNVYLTNDRVTPFLDGASFIALKAQKQVAEARKIFVVPIAFKFTHLDDVHAGICDRLEHLAGEVGTEFDRSADSIDELKRIGQQLLHIHLRKRGLLVDGDKEFSEQFASAAEKILASVEERLELRPKPSDTPVTRVRKVRARLHQLRTDENKGPDYSESHVAAWADDAITAFRILNYCTPYAAETPTVDRFAETTERMMEDHHSKALPPLGRRRVVAHISEPIDLSERMESFSRRSRAAVGELSLDLEQAVQAGLDAENDRNHAPGARLFGHSCDGAT